MPPRHRARQPFAQVREASRTRAAERAEWRDDPTEMLRSRWFPDTVQIVLDPEFRHPGYEVHDTPRPQGIEVTDAATDPALLAETRLLVAEYTDRYTTLRGKAPRLHPGYDESRILDAERTLGFRLPEELRALYRVVGGSEYGLLGSHWLSGLEFAVGQYFHNDPPGAVIERADAFGAPPVIFDSYPPGRIRRLARSRWWLPMGSDIADSTCAVDLDPAPLGRRGQLFGFEKCFPGQACYIAESVTAVIRQSVAALREARSPEHLEELVENIGVGLPPRHECRLNIGEQEAGDVLAAIRTPALVQELHLDDAGWLDLAALAPFENLRSLSVRRGEWVNAGLPHLVPVEVLHLDADEADIGRLAGHPALRHLTLAYLGAPVRVDSLAAIPNLQTADLSRVDVADAGRLADLPGLRVLTLHAEQWLRMRRAGSVPRHLAAVRITDVQDFDDTDLAEWAEWLRSR